MSTLTLVPAPAPAALTDGASAMGAATCSRFDLALLSTGLATRCGAGLLHRASALPALDEEERAARAARLNALWASGARRCVDEGLFADAVRRNPDIARTLAGTARPFAAGAVTR